MPPRRQKKVTCNCPLKEFEHQVLETELAAHRAEAEALERGKALEEDTNLSLTAARLVLIDDPDDESTHPIRFDWSTLLADVKQSIEAVPDPRYHRRQLAPAKQQARVLNALAHDLEAAIRELKDRTPQKPEELWKKAARTRDVALLVANSLQDHTESSAKAELVTRLKYLENELEIFERALPEDPNPLFYDSAYAFDDPVHHLNVISQMMFMFALICKHILNLAVNSVNFILNSMLLFTAMAFEVSSLERGPSPPGGLQSKILDELPTSFHDAMTQMNLDGKTVLYAVCPSCHHLHAPSVSTAKNNIRGIAQGSTWVSHCENTIVGFEGRSPCNTPLLNGGRPIKPYLSPSLLDFLARLLSNPRIEKLIEDSCIDPADPPGSLISHAFEAEYLQKFEGPEKDGLFIKKRPGRLPIVLSQGVDFYPPTGSTIHSSSASIGVIKLTCLNLPIDEANAPENTYVAVLPGISAPKGADLNPYFKPIIDVAVQGWKRGIHLSQTALHDKGRLISIAMPLSVNDTLAARQVAGMAAHSHTIYCTCCDCRGRATVYNTQFDQWKYRNVAQLRRAAERWRDAETLGERKEIYREYGVYWSENWRLPYWDPTRGLVPDPMHVPLEGVVNYYSRRVLKIDLTVAKERDPAIRAFDEDWLDFNTGKFATNSKITPKTEGDRKQVHRIQRLLQRELIDAEEDEDEVQADMDDIDDEDHPEDDDDTPKTSAKQPPDTKLTTEVLIRRLEGYRKPALAWRMTKPKLNPTYVPPPKIMPPESIAFIQCVIAKTQRPIWVRHVPKNFGEAGAGSPKADELRTLAHIYLPISLVILWGEKQGEEAAIFKPVLDHGMALFQALNLVYGYTTDRTRVTRGRQHFKQWVDDLFEVHPHTKRHRRRTIVHMFFHTFEFLVWWGPAFWWWCFPLERLIGLLQKVKTNGRLGGNLRRWINQANCPPLLREFHRIFTKYFGSNLGGAGPQNSDKNVSLGPHAHCDYGGVHYSRASTHIGNSLISYTTGAGKVVAGSIESIEILETGPQFLVRRQAPLPAGKNDPFKPFPDLRAKTYSSKTPTGFTHEQSLRIDRSHHHHGQRQALRASPVEARLGDDMHEVSSTATPVEKDLFASHGAIPSLAGSFLLHFMNFVSTVLVAIPTLPFASKPSSAREISDLQVAAGRHWDLRVWLQVNLTCSCCGSWCHSRVTWTRQMTFESESKIYDVPSFVSASRADTVGDTSFHDADSYLYAYSSLVVKGQILHIATYYKL
ncbi:hypothetical protein B0H16DRAFT_1725162 [Mycena metata]|uniref:Uncharacterized protein n=1 Tax=Mycena metata TaxID=1033252 RepID=A0AAD7IRR4_9AGAR|nr:hypothetical protein B0H16DRAFT_1725162 [Mycena metata]